MNEAPAHRSRRKPFWCLVGLILIALVGVLDHITGYEVSFALFYLAAIATTTWHAGRTLGIASAVLSAAVWYAVDRTTGHVYSHPAIAYWNAGVRLGFFVIVVGLISALLDALRKQEEMARIDPVTGAANRREFCERVAHELDRAHRYSRASTLAFLDLDNFKEVNDRLGHAAGDEVLRTVATTLRQRLRKTDLLARVGGDEFALFLPETDQAAARQVVEAVRSELLARMREQSWPVTFSIGVLTAEAFPDGVESLLQRSDELMYRVKRTTKDAVLYENAAGA